MPIAANTLLRADGLRKSLADGDTDVFHRVVGINFEVAFGLNLEVDKAMPSDLIEHVIKKRDARIKVFFARSIEVQAHMNLGLGRITAKFGDSHGAMIQFGA